MVYDFRGLHLSGASGRRDGLELRHVCASDAGPIVLGVCGLAL